MKATFIAAVVPVLVVFTLGLFFAFLGHSFSPLFSAPMFACGTFLGYWISNVYLSYKDEFAVNLLKPKLKMDGTSRLWIVLGCIVCITSAPLFAFVEGFSIANNLSVSGAIARFFVATVQPIAEELIFRIVLFLFLLRLGAGFLLAVLLQAVFFCAAHPGYGLLGQSIIFIWSILLLVTVVLYKSIWPAIILHISINLGQLIRAVLVGENFSSMSSQYQIDVSEFSNQLVISLPIVMWLFLLICRNRSMGVTEFVKHAGKIKVAPSVGQIN